MDPAGVRQDSPGRKPWEPWQARMSALKGRCRLLRPFQSRIPGVHVPGFAPSLSCSTLSGSERRGTPGEGMSALSQGLRPGLSCSTLSGSSAFSIRVSPWHVSETCDNRHGSWAAADGRPSAPHQEFTGNQQTAQCHCVKCGQQPAFSWEPRGAPWPGGLRKPRQARSRRRRIHRRASGSEWRRRP